MYNLRYLSLAATELWWAWRGLWRSAGSLGYHFHNCVVIFAVFINTVVVPTTAVSPRFSSSGGSSQSACNASQNSVK